MRIVALCLFLSSCSMMFMERVKPQTKPGQPVYCTATKGFPAWSTVIGLGNAGVGAYWIASTVRDNGTLSTNDRQALNALGWLSVGIGAIYLYDAIKGGGWAAECLAARQATE